MVASSSIFLSPLHLSHLKPNHVPKQSLSILSPLALSSNHKLSISPPNYTQIWRIPAIPNNNFLISEANPVEPATEQLVTTTTTDASNIVVSVLVVVAFVGLSVLTIGVIYIGVTDFLQKRETEKIEKEEAVKVKNDGTKFGQKGPSPRGFGRKNIAGQKKTDKKPKPKPMPKPKPKPMPKQTDKKANAKAKAKPKPKSRGKK